MGSALFSFCRCCATRLPDEGDGVGRSPVPRRHQDLGVKSMGITMSLLAAHYDGQDVRNQRIQRRSDNEVSA